MRFEIVEQLGQSTPQPQWREHIGDAAGQGKLGIAHRYHAPDAAQRALQACGCDAYLRAGAGERTGGGPCPQPRLALQLGAQSLRQWTLTACALMRVAALPANHAQVVANVYGTVQYSLQAERA